VSQENGDNCIVLYPGTNAKYTAEYAKEVLEHFGPGDWILQQNEISQGGGIMNVAADKGMEVRLYQSQVQFWSTFIHLYKI
jgi:ribokinase